MVKTRTSRLAELTEYVKYKSVFYLSFRLTNMILFDPGRTIHIKFVKSYLQRYTTIKAPIKLAGISNFTFSDPSRQSALLGLDIGMCTWQISIKFSINLAKIQLSLYSFPCTTRVEWEMSGIMLTIRGQCCANVPVGCVWHWRKVSSRTIRTRRECDWRNAKIEFQERLPANKPEKKTFS